MSLLVISCALTKGKNKTSEVALNNQKVTKADSTRQDSTKKKLRPYKEIIKDNAVTQNGFLKVHKVDDRYYFEIPDSLLERDILVVNRISKAPTLMAYGGDQIGEVVIQFSKSANNKIFIKRGMFVLRSNDTTANSMNKAIENSNYLTIISAFDIKAIAPDSGAVVIDMTDYLNSDNPVFLIVV